MKKSLALYHALAVITIMVWGVTFISTKLIISAGLTPVEIFIIRFGIAYLCALILSHRKLWANSVIDELMLLLAGITGGSLYFIAENTALSFTFATNVSLIICCTPIFTTLLGKAVYGYMIKPRVWIGSVTAFTGVGIVVFNGAENFGINPVGDLLTGLAALSWAAYCLILKSINRRYDNTFITRKVFAYGVFTAFLYYSLIPSSSHTMIPDIWAVVWNLLFLSIGASFLCYLMWNAAVKILGPETTSNYIYLVPLVTIIASTIVLAEPFTLQTGLGALLIIGGVILSTKSINQ